MKKSVMKKWVAALRGGKYKRGSRVLRKKLNGVDRFCCLGVLCDISKKVRWVESVHEPVYYAESESGESILTRLTIGVLDWAGMSDAYGSMEGRQRSLSSINDSGKYSFAKIADIIEKNWERL